MHNQYPKKETAMLTPKKTLRLVTLAAAAWALGLIPSASAGTKPAPDTSSVGATKSIWDNASFSGSAGITYYVATNGNDNNSGTSSGSPLKTIQAAIDKGETEYNTNNKNVKIKVAVGTYREAFLLDYADGRSSQAFILERDGGSGTVNITGAELYADGWTHAGGGVYTHAWTKGWGFGDVPFSNQDAKDDLEDTVLARREAVFVDDTLLEHIVGAGSLAEGQFRVDDPNDIIKIKDSNVTFTGTAGNLVPNKDIEVATHLDPTDPDESKLEGCRVQFMENVKLLNLTFSRFPTMWQRGGLGVNDVTNLWIRGCTIEENSAAGLHLVRVDKVQLENNIVQNNGSLGIAATEADNVWMLNGEVRWNNQRGAWMDYARFYIGGAKFGESEHVKVVATKFTANKSHGLWFDVNCSDTYVLNCDIIDNKLGGSNNNGNGFFYEISPGPAKLQGCTISGSDHGAYVSNATNVYLYDNSILANDKAEIVLRSIIDRTDPETFCDNFWMEQNTVTSFGTVKLVKALGTNSEHQKCLNNATINNNDYWADATNTTPFQKVVGSNVSFASWQNTSNPTRDTNSDLEDNP